MMNRSSTALYGMIYSRQSKQFMLTPKPGKLLLFQKTHVLFLLFLSFCSYSYAQEVETNDIKGIITDRGSSAYLEGADIELLNISPKKMAKTNENGSFTLTEVPTGRHRILVSMDGYEQVMVTDILVASGKRMLIKIGLEESLVQKDEKETTKAKNQGRYNALIAKTTKDKPNNQMAGVSARPFTIEEVTRFAGSRFDPARMVTNYAGASGYDDSRNDIVIRGNSPVHILWQIEDLPIENPNHVGTIGTTGGITPILNVYALGQADFMSGAFAAQYGNAIGGVFDLKLREGNTDNFGMMAQIGTQRAEILMEGPLGKAGNGGSFLLSVRASTGNYFLGKIIPVDPEHQDFNLKISSGRKNWGELDFFAIGGRSRVWLPYESTTFPDESSPFFVNYEQRAFYNQVKYDIFEYEDYSHSNLMGLAGLKYTTYLNRRSFWRTVVGVSHHQTNAFWEYNEEDSLGEVIDREKTYTIDDYRTNYMLHSFIQSKLNRSLSIKGGIMANIHDLNLYEEYILDESVDYDWQGNYMLAQAYFQMRYQVSNNFVMNIGMHSQYSSLTNEFVAEPRLALNWEFVSGHIFSAGYGWHHQTNPYLTQFFNPWLEDEDDYYYDHPTELKFISSHHMVGSYDWLISQNLRLKVEGYLQLLSNIPVEQDSSAYSQLNIGASFYDFYTGPLENGGKGQNWGLELTLEKFFSNSFYGLLSASYFDSKYTGSDGVWRNTLFNNQYIVNFLVGKEFLLGPRKNTVLFTDLRFSTMGGKPYTPIDIEATFNDPYGEQNFVEAETNARNLATFYQVDFKFGLRINGSRMSHTIKFDLFNVTNLFGVQNPLTVRYSERFDPSSGSVQMGQEETIYQRGFIPDITYSVQF